MAWVWILIKDGSFKKNDSDSQVNQAYHGYQKIFKEEKAANILTSSPNECPLLYTNMGLVAWIQCLKVWTLVIYLTFVCRWMTRCFKCQVFMWNSLVNVWQYGALCLLTHVEEWSIMIQSLFYHDPFTVEIINTCRRMINNDPRFVLSWPTHSEDN